MEKNFTKEYFADKILNDDRWLRKAIVAIYKFQTETEKEIAETCLTNHRGFTKADAQFLSGLAEWINSGRNLSEKQKIVARKRMIKYCGQLVRIATKKQELDQEAVDLPVNTKTFKKPASEVEDYEKAYEKRVRAYKARIAAAGRKQRSNPLY